MAALSLIALIFFAAQLSSDASAEPVTINKAKLSEPLPANLFIELAKAINPAVVNVFTTYLPKRRFMRSEPYRDPLFEMFEQFMGPNQIGPSRPQESLGSGFIIREDGLILTNNHVIDGADIIKVQISENTKESFDAKLIGKDDKVDVAIIKVNANRKLPYVKLGASADVQVGEWVAAFGNPYGYGHSMTKGIISAVGREINELNLFPFMQTDASINPGNSGGPLVNTQGQVIGVNTAIDARAQGIGFVIPIDNVKGILPQLEKDGGIQRGAIGVGLIDISEEDARSLHLRETEGALVTQVFENSPAAKAGVQTYDLITEFAGKKITSRTDLVKAVITTPIGKKVSMTVIRNGKPVKLEIAVAKNVDLSKVIQSQGGGHGNQGRGRNHRHGYSGDGGNSGDRGDHGDRGERGDRDDSDENRESDQLNGAEGVEAPYNLGFVTADYSPSLAREFNLPRLDRSRPVVVEVADDGPAGHSGLAPGDILLDVNRKPVTHAREILKELHKGSVNILRVLKQDRVVLISIRVP